MVRSVAGADEIGTGAASFRSDTIPIDPGYVRYRNVCAYQIARMYEADIDVAIQSPDGAAMNLVPLQAKAMKRHSSRERRDGVVNAVLRTVAN